LIKEHSVLRIFEEVKYLPKGLSVLIGFMR
jgi:hypothetical protein